MRPLRQPVLLALCCCSASVIAFGPTVLGSRVTQQAGVGPDRVPAVAVEPEVPATVRVESRRLVPENEMHAFLGRYEAASSHAPTFNYGSSMADLRPRAGSGVREFVLNESVGVGMDRGIVVDGPSREENPRLRASVTHDGLALLTAQPHIAPRPQKRDDGVWRNPNQDLGRPVWRGPGPDPFKPGPPDAGWTIAGWTIKAYDLTGAVPTVIPYDRNVLARHVQAFREAQRRVRVQSTVPKDEFETTDEWRARQQLAAEGLDDRLLLAWRDHARFIVADIPVDIGRYNADRGIFNGTVAEFHAITDVAEDAYGYIVGQSGPGVVSQTRGVDVAHAATSTMKPLPIYTLSLAVPLEVETARRVRAEAPACTADVEFVMTPEQNLIIVGARIRIDGLAEVVLPR